MNNAIKVDQWWSSHTEYYADAFAAEFRRIWRGIDYVAKSDEELHNICYYRALTCFLRSDDAAIVDRRRLLYAYLLSEFESRTAEDTINRYRKQLPVNSMVRRVIKNICTAYDEEPSRVFSTMERTNNVMESLYKQLKVSTQIQRIYHRARLTGLVLVRPFILNGQWHVDYMTPDQFRLETDPDDVRTITAVTYPRRSLSGGVEYVKWTSEMIFNIDINGNIYEQEEHNYGRIPFAVCRLTDDDDVYTSGMIELVESQLHVNKTRFLANTNLVFAGSPAWVAINMEVPSLRIAPDKVITIDGVQQGEGAEAHPTLDAVTPEPSYQAMEEYARERERSMQHDEGIPPSMTGHDVSTPPSGISRLIERNEIIELRISDQKALREFERDFARLVAIVALSDSGADIAPESIDLQVSYAEEAVIIEPDKEYDFDKKKLADGVMTVQQFYRKWSGLDKEENELVEEIVKRREESAQLFTTVTQDTV